MTVKLTYYSAPWCAPCKKVMPKVKALADEVSADLDVIDIDKTPVADVMSVPTLDILVDGQLVKRVTGWANRTTIDLIGFIRDVQN